MLSVNARPYVVEQWDEQVVTVAAQPAEQRPCLQDFILPKQPSVKCNGGDIVRPGDVLVPKPHIPRTCNPSQSNGLDFAIVKVYLERIITLLEALLEKQPRVSEPQRNNCPSEDELLFILSMLVSLTQQVNPEMRQLSAQFEQTLRGQIIFA
ncbi:MAG: hypothetical protein RMM17_00340 [Acidobacteriota bacterium]|nr:hypothetical protein [Blastocatellia bacterium]MDW8411114.1 hypothetical protein [Acidobacteriota bacterium]